MRMQETDLEFIVFDSRDVIVTSGGGGEPIPTVIPIIWLAPDSVFNFNNYTTGYLLETKWAKRGLYTSFNGQLDTWEEPPYYIFSGYSEGVPTDGIYTVGKDGSGYKDVLAWLEHKSSGQ